MTYLDPKNDVTFRKVFGQNKRILISFLNALLPLKTNEEITEIEYANPELLPDAAVLKNTIVDIRCRDISGREFLVEMQLLWVEHFESRILFNACKAFSQQITKGANFNQLSTVYSLNIINQYFSNQNSVWYHHYKLSHQSIKNQYINGIEFILIELPNFIPEKVSQNKLTLLWIRFLKEIKNKSTMIPQELLEVPEIAEAVEALKRTSYTQEELEKYDRYWDAVSTQKTMMSDAFSEGEVKGAFKKALEIAATLKESNYPVEEIVRLTKLNKEIIEGL